MIEIESIKRLDVKPGDTLVVKVPNAMSAAELELVREVVREKLPADVEVLITSGDIEFEVIGHETAVADA